MLDAGRELLSRPVGKQAECFKPAARWHVCRPGLLSLQQRLQLRLEPLGSRHGWRGERCALYTLANEFYSRYHVRLL